jgi:hypothetical protein
MLSARMKRASFQRPFKPACKSYQFRGQEACRHFARPANPLLHLITIGVGTLPVYTWRYYLEGTESSCPHHRQKLLANQMNCITGKLLQARASNCTPGCAGISRRRDTE